MEHPHHDQKITFIRTSGSQLQLVCKRKNDETKTIDTEEVIDIVGKLNEAKQSANNHLFDFLKNKINNVQMLKEIRPEEQILKPNQVYKAFHEAKNSGSFRIGDKIKLNAGDFDVYLETNNAVMNEEVKKSSCSKHSKQKHKHKHRHKCFSKRRYRSSNRKKNYHSHKSRKHSSMSSSSSSFESSQSLSSFSSEEEDPRGVAKSYSSSSSFHSKSRGTSKKPRLTQTTEESNSESFEFEPYMVPFVIHPNSLELSQNGIYFPPNSH